MKHNPLKASKGPLSIAKQLRWLAEHMKDIGTSMDYYGGFSKFMVDRGEELVGAGLVAESWAEEIEREMKAENISCKQ